MYLRQVVWISVWGNFVHEEDYDGAWTYQHLSRQKQRVLGQETASKTAQIRSRFDDIPSASFCELLARRLGSGITWFRDRVGLRCLDALWSSVLAFLDVLFVLIGPPRCSLCFLGRGGDGSSSSLRVLAEQGCLGEQERNTPHRHIGLGPRLWHL